MFQIDWMDKITVIWQSKGVGETSSVIKLIQMGKGTGTGLLRSAVGLTTSLSLSSIPAITRNLALVGGQNNVASAKTSGSGMATVAFLHLAMMKWQ